jgi:hypothetical protein
MHPKEDDTELRKKVAKELMVNIPALHAAQVVHVLEYKREERGDRKSANDGEAENGEG